MPTQTLQITPQLGTEVGRKFARISYDHGDGFTPSVLVGHSQGLKVYRCTFNALPDRSSHTVSDPEDSGATKTWAVYLLDFHRYRMVDGQPFNITDSVTGTTVLVKFVSDEILLKQTNSKKVYSTEFLVQQYRDPA